MRDGRRVINRNGFSEERVTNKAAIEARAHHNLDRSTFVVLQDNINFCSCTRTTTQEQFWRSFYTHLKSDKSAAMFVLREMSSKCVSGSISWRLRPLGLVNSADAMVNGDLRCGSKYLFRLFFAQACAITYLCGLTKWDCWAPTLKKVELG